LWPIDDWPRKLDESTAVMDLPIWVSEVGASSFGAEEVQEFGLHRSAELLIGRLSPLRRGSIANGAASRPSRGSLSAAWSNDIL